MHTIFALSTPAGKSGVAVVRISGTQATQTLRALGVALPRPRQATVARLRIACQEREQSERPMRESAGGRGATYETLDEALVLYFPAPHSFTGEDIVEFHIHGSRAVARSLLAALGALPSLRPAEPGEFTRRAFLNGKMDLTAAEGLADLIDAETEAQRRQALRFMQGEAAAFYGRLREGILQALALSEAYIDFPDEEIPASVLEETAAHVHALAQMIEGQLADKGACERIRDGVQVAILGPPNAGKSSLLNWLAQRDVAIVSETAGTTRDVIEVHLDIAGMAVIIADTAGIREAGGAIEREGMRRSLERAGAADVRIVVLDATDIGSGKLETLIDADTLLLLNKTDLALPSPLPVIAGAVPLPVSVTQQRGLDAFMAMLAARIGATTPPESSFIARSRHRHHLKAALAHLQRYAAARGAGLELACEELRRAAVEIGAITGAVSADEVLGQIFSRFCIGK